MKSRIHGMLLSLFFALVFCLSFGIEASAHQYKTYTHSNDLDVEAKDVGIADAEMMKKFLLHAAKHIELIVDDENLDEENKQETSIELAIFSRMLLREKGVFNNGETYIIAITERGAMIDHGLYYGDSYGKRYFDDDNPVDDTIGTLLAAGNLSDGADSIVCKDYEHDGKQRVACAINQNRPALGTSALATITTIAGYHHAKDDLIDPDCSVLTSQLTDTAADVENETDPDMKEKRLESFVKGVIAGFSQQQGVIVKELMEEVQEILAGGGQIDPQAFPTKAAVRGYEIAPCFKESELFHGSVYAFVMNPVHGTSFMNGLDFNLHGGSVDLDDPDPIDGENVLTAFQKAVTNGSGDLADLAEGNSGFVTYHWDNPTVEGDEVEDYLEKGQVPGNSIKKSYLEVIDTTDPRSGKPTYLVFGSGIYLDEDEDDGGCSIAATGSTHQGALLNLVLAASVLFSVVFLRRRV